MGKELSTGVSLVQGRGRRKNPGASETGRMVAFENRDGGCVCDCEDRNLSAVTLWSTEKMGWQRGSEREALGHWRRWFLWPLCLPACREGSSQGGPHLHSSLSLFLSLSGWLAARICLVLPCLQELSGAFRSIPEQPFSPYRWGTRAPEFKRDCRSVSQNPQGLGLLSISSLWSWS